MFSLDHTRGYAHNSKNIFFNFLVGHREMGKKMFWGTFKNSNIYHARGYAHKYKIACFKFFIWHSPEKSQEMARLSTLAFLSSLALGVTSKIDIIIILMCILLLKLVHFQWFSVIIITVCHYNIIDETIDTFATNY